MDLNQLEDTYLEERKHYNDQLEELHYYKKQGIVAIDDLAERSHYYLRQLDSDEVDFSQVHHYLDGERSAFELSVKKEENKINSTIEELETQYKRDRQRQEERGVDKA